MNAPHLDAEPSGVGRGRASALQALAEAINSEIRLLEDLIGVMRRQRSAVAADDLQAIDDSVYATHRVLVTLTEARRRRRSLSQIVCGTDDFPLRDLELLLGEEMTDELRDSRDGLHAAALTLSQEVEMNRQVLRQAMAAGSEYVRSLYGGQGAEGVALYSAEPQRVERESSRGGILVDRRA
ncbi:MAG TPA: flagellar export chaperone FlgN [Longimicrobiaceae bacterium]